ncbi:MAG: hypothetical protein BGO55_14230 [Sphingobacteriales bacterium 50-39]|nr:nuclear transport factor 2 family protein [Sphingobacteriales bacterium]OJW57446.1 MAG: hypothetical protein BGO55_14230 [Sphingobacteriales bacterium 50-39]
MKFSNFFCLGLLSLCSLNLFAQKPTASVIKEVEQAEAKMFQNMTSCALQKQYMKTDMADDFFTINADGVSADKEQIVADTSTWRCKMFEATTNKFFDRKVRVYGNVAITSGRAQAYLKANGAMVAEFLYTTVFVKKNGKWMYTSWQGTLSKDSPKLPPVTQQ